MYSSLPEILMYTIIQQPFSQRKVPVNVLSCMNKGAGVRESNLFANGYYSNAL